MPDWLEPMAATLTQERFAGNDWLFERKFDGIRLLAYKHGGDVKLYSRNRLLQNLPSVAKAIAAIAGRRVDSRRRGDVGRPQQLSRVRHPVARTARSTTELPLEERRDLLKTLKFTAPLQARRPARRRRAVGARAA